MGHLFKKPHQMTFQMGTEIFVSLISRSVLQAGENKNGQSVPFPVGQPPPYLFKVDHP